MKTVQILTPITAGLCLALMIGCATPNKPTSTEALKTSQDPPQNSPAEQIPYAIRLKQARQPYAYVVFEQMDVHEGMEEEYLEIESEWSKVHEYFAQQGKLLSWGLAKAKPNELGYEYVTWKTFRSLQDIDTSSSYDWKQIATWMGEDKLSALFQKTPLTRTITGSQVLRLQNYALMPLAQSDSLQNLKPSDISFRINFLKPKQGQRQKYLEVVNKAYAPIYEKKAEVDKTFIGWEYQELLFHNGESLNTEPFRGIDIYRNDIPELNERDKESINDQLPPWPEDIHPADQMNALRSIKSVDFDVVLTTSINPEKALMANLEGTWTHTFPNGAYRTKVITPFEEQMTVFEADGTLRNANPAIPFRVEVSGGLNRFTGFFPNGKTWNASILIQNGKWYEQMRAFTDLDQFNGINPAAPDAFFVYQKSNKPTKGNNSPYDNSRYGTELIRNIVNAYAEGDLTKYRNYYNDDARAVHNQWGPTSEGMSIDELVQIHKAHHATLKKPIEILHSIYEVVTLPNGSKHAHGWIHFRNTYKSGTVADTYVFVSIGLDDNGKATYEWALYNPTGVPTYQK